MFNALRPQVATWPSLKRSGRPHIRQQGPGNWRQTLQSALPALATALTLVLPANAQTLKESPFFQTQVDAGEMPAVSERVPSEPLVVDLGAKGRELGTPGGTLRTMVTRSKDVRQMVVYGYARLVGYDHNYRLQADILRDVTVQEGRIFTLHLRKNHHWSDGTPFTSADFRYWWEDIVGNSELTPSGIPEFLRNGTGAPDVSFPDAHTVRFEWRVPHPSFLATLAQARPPFIYRPAHYLKTFHIQYADPDTLEQMVDKARANSWAALHNRVDNMYKNDNPELPTLQPWISKTTGKKASRYIFARNPYYHRIDANGVQLPYIDTVEMSIVGGGLVAAKSNAGETDLQARGLDFRNISILKKGEVEGGNYVTHLWANGTASQIAIFPNLNYNDPIWRDVMRDVRFRRALSLGIDRQIINRALYFGMARVGGMTALDESPLYKAARLDRWSQFDLESANALLDEMGLTERDRRGIRLLPDGRPMEFVIETAGERQEVENALAITTDTWRDIGIKLIMRPLDRDILRNRAYAGVTMASVWYGWDNGLMTPKTAPDFAAPIHQEFLAWPKWGQYHQTHGENGQAPDLPAAQRLMELASAWRKTSDAKEQEAIWSEILDIHAEQQFAIGILAAAPQPVVVNRHLRNVPHDGVWAWDPGAHFGIHRIDEFWFDDLKGSNS